MTAERFTRFETSSKNPLFTDVQDVSVAETHTKMSEVLLVDVRRPDEWVGELGHIPEATLITLDTLPSRIQEIPKNRTIVFVCRSGARSAQATSYAKQNGYPSVFNMKGGMLEWSKNNFEVSDRNGGN